MAGIIDPNDPNVAVDAIDAVPLTPAHVAQLAAARDRSRKLRRAVGVAKFDAWGTAVFAGFTILFSITSPSGLLLGVGMAIVAWREFTQGTALRRLEPYAAKNLAINQLCLGGMLILYAGWSLFLALTTSGEYDEIVKSAPEAASMVGSIGDLARTISLAVYGGVILVAVFVQGGTAMYYRSRAKLVQAYLAETPEWIIDLNRKGVEI